MGLTSLAKRVGVFGGAFDPPHLAHRALVETALGQLQLDELRVVPTGHAWHKQRSLSSAEHRVNMARLAFGDLPKVLIDERETHRAGASYTVDTLHEMQGEQAGSEWFLVLGGDQARALPTWRNWQELLKCATICIAQRQDASAPQGEADPFVALFPSWPGRFVRLQLAENPVSATQIRQQLAQGQDVSPLVGPAVARYIAQHHLYSTPA